MFDKILEMVGTAAPKANLYNVVIVVVTQGEMVSGSLKTYVMSKEHLVGLEKILLGAEEKLLEAHSE